ncbi:1-phosphatidylinositol-3-phosphate 5-kinase FAB1B-like [Olea europaea var. sylvestris]|uniref:1-phosphatidylinositol-3-phosphate 5-kinase FAB1B-like n=1 Tax=Olea europaea var. sylvestris TaxID=158386 RepID=UPI000C1D7AD7|nr:1-phosphatidylinositol-3-phosphate 5-kinase FAB1B-like [Olea europaea var. sylvestris]
MNKAVDEHFRALITQLLHLGNLPVTEDSNEESWLNIITALPWEAARLLKPDMSIGGGMDPGGYVKVKCIASGVLIERCTNHRMFNVGDGEVLCVSHPWIVCHAAVFHENIFTCACNIHLHPPISLFL